MQESEFLQILETKAQEQQKVLKNGLLPDRLAIFARWLGIHPWRVLIPVSMVIYIACRIFWGEGARELILKLFGKF